MKNIIIALSILFAGLNFALADTNSTSDCKDLVLNESSIIQLNYEEMSKEDIMEVLKVISHAYNFTKHLITPSIFVMDNRPNGSEDSKEKALATMCTLSKVPGVGVYENSKVEPF